MAGADDFNADLEDDDGIELDQTDIAEVIDAEDADDDDAEVDAAPADAAATTDDNADAADDDDDDADLDEDDEEEGEASLEVLLGQDETQARTKAPRAVPSAVTATIGEGEFTCRSCFLVKRRAQLADPDKMICFDCV